MKTLTVWQPWASLIAFGEKQFETRSWTTKYRGPLAIHAGMRFTMQQQTLCWQLPFASALIRHSVHTPADLPMGRVVCIADLIDVVPTHGYRSQLSKQELIFGDYRDGRYAWKLANVHVLCNALPATGRQGLWEWPFTMGPFAKAVEKS
jgi:hypothetical protein